MDDNSSAKCSQNYLVAILLFAPSRNMIGTKHYFPFGHVFSFFLCHFLELSNLEGGLDSPMKLYPAKVNCPAFVPFSSFY